MITLNVKLPLKQYPIYIEKGLMKNIGEHIRKIYKNKKIVIITDENVSRIYEEEVTLDLKKNGFIPYTIKIKPGEKSKSLSNAEKIYEDLLELEITRKDMIVALGGGVVGDLAGFVASTFLRGIPFIQIPTSLLAQIDSSVGGKVAVNLSKGKNLVGSFYHPEAVFIDPNVLSTLEKRFFHDGIAEAIKYGCIKDEKLFYKLYYYTKEELWDHIEEIIYTCCKIKGKIVEKDEKDTGGRMLLNFGHTIGHAVEKYFHYETYTHGEAVAIGMYTITQKSEEIGQTEKGTSGFIKKILEKYNLSHALPKVDKNKIIETVKVDKKRDIDHIHIILLNEIGDGFIKKIKKEDFYQYV